MVGPTDTTSVSTNNDAVLFSGTDHILHITADSNVTKGVSNMKAILLAINHAYLFFGTTLYVGILWSLRFFWFPSWTKLRVDNYFDQFVPQTDAATAFFTIVVPIMFISIIVMAIAEWKTSYRWVPLSAFVFLGSATYVGTMHIIPVNKILKQTITDQARLTELMLKWMSLNDIRWVLLTLMWLVLMYYFLAKGNMFTLPSGNPASSGESR